MVAIIDYGAGNLHSVKNALDYLGAESVVTSDSDVIASADRVILPGVGAFGDAMRCMTERGLVDAARSAADGSKPFLGICLWSAAVIRIKRGKSRRQGAGCF